MDTGRPVARKIRIQVEGAICTLSEIKAARFAEVLDLVLAEMGKDSAAITGDPKSARWKIDAALRLRKWANAPHA